MTLGYDVNFGTIAARPRPSPGPAFRLAVLGDFSGRASKGVIETGAKLMARKPLRVDADTLDDVIARLAPRIVIPLGDEGTVAVPVASMDDLHPDQIAEALPFLQDLLELRRKVQSRTGFDHAMKEVLSWAGAEPLLAPDTRRARGGAVAVDRKLGDFARLTGRTATVEADSDALIRRLIGPYIVPATDSRQDALVARVDAALSDATRRVLHHPEFQAAEALWRGVDMLVRRLETGSQLQIVLYDISAEELAADLAARDAIEDTALYSLLLEQPAADAGAGPLSMVAGLYDFALSPPHADLLGRIAQLAATAGAPFVAAMGADGLLVPEHDWNPIIRSAWSALRSLPASVYLGLATPRFLLRMPYGKRTDPIDAFAFEEFTRHAGLSGMLWGNPALLVAQCAAASWLQGGRAMALGTVNVVGDLPVYVVQDSDGDQVALPCTERLLTERQAALVAARGIIPVVGPRGRPEVRVAGFASVAGPPLAGRWAPVEVKAPTPPSPAPPPSAVPSSAAPSSAPPSSAAPSSAAPPAAPVATQAAIPPVRQPPAPQPAAPQPPADDDLDALLASLGAEPPPVPPDETDADLDALLASLK